MSKDDEMVRALQARRGPPKALLLGGIGGVVVVGAVIAVATGGTGEASEAWSSLSKCMIGEPLAEGENVFFRIREVELAREEGWPARCAEHATKLHRAIDGSGQTVLLKRLLREQLTCGDAENEPCKFPESGQPLTKADETWNAAKLAGLELVDVPGVEAPKGRLKPVLGKELPSLGSAELRLADHKLTESGEIWMVLEPRKDSKQKPRWCKLAPSGEKATCADVAALPDSLGDPRFIPDATVPAIAGFVDTDDGGRQRDVFSLADGKPMKTRGDVRNGHVLERRGNDLYLLEVSDGLVKSQEKLALAEGAEAIVFAGWLGWLEVDDETSARKLSWQKIGAGAKLEGDVVVLDGEIPPRVEPCPVSGGGVLYGRVGTPEKQSAWFLASGKWSKPVSAALPAGQRREWTAVCAPGRVTRSWVKTQGDKATLGGLDCTPKGCSVKESEWKGAPVKQWLAVSVLGDKTVSLYETFRDDKRLQIGDAEPVVLMDAFDYSGPKLENPRVMVGPKLVVVLFDDEKDLHALYVNDAGKYGAVNGS